MDRLPSAWVARQGARRRHGPRADHRRQWKRADAAVRYYGMHVIGFWPLWTIAIAIIMAVWAAGYQDGLQ